MEAHVPVAFPSSIFVIALVDDERDASLSASISAIEREPDGGWQWELKENLLKAVCKTEPCAT